MRPYIISLICSVALGIVGQISLKAGALEGSKTGSIYLQHYTILGLTTYFLASIFYIYALKKIPLSIAFPSVSISYVIVSFAAHMIWGEEFGLKQIIALVLIGSGIFILSRSQ